MAELNLVKVGNSLRPAYDEDGERLRKMKAGTIYRAEVTAPRDQVRHRKFFALLNLAFGYWEPETMVSNIEKETVDKLSDYLKRSGVDSEAVSVLAGNFVAELERKRAGLSLERDFQCFREHITVAAGFFELVSTPAGPKKVAKSISFANMEQVAFDDLYRAVLAICWELCLSRCFGDMNELAETLLKFE